MSENNPIWKRIRTVDELNQLGTGTMVEVLGIVFTVIGEDYLEAVMPVDHRTVQPYGILHGGANVALAESLASTAALLCADDGKACVGIEINANHIRQVRKGSVRGKAVPLHIGRSTQVWQIDIYDDEERLVARSRMTAAVIDR